MALYEFQKRVYENLIAGRAVILLAPTGAGKTRAALYPFLRAWEEGIDLPRKCIYSVPLRVLANQFWAEYEGRTRNFGFTRPLNVGIQTGEHSEDPRLEDSLIFTTIDQTLSNFLNIPYALSIGQGNLNAGAIMSSYLVFDEIHLFDPETTLPTTLHLLRLLRSVVPFLVMTATVSREMVQLLAEELNAEALVLRPEEVAAIPSQNKIRRIHTVESELSAEAILEHHQSRSIVICNTVERTQAVFESLRRKAGPGTEVRLLHSRFLHADRQAIENWVHREFGRDKTAYTVESAILVATQVVEVGLDITSQTLHTELAPAASIIQRAGRCARYEGEEGDVWVYRLPIDETGRPAYAPYLGEQKSICEKTWSALAERSGLRFGFAEELDVVNQAHKEANQKILNSLRANRFYIADRITATIEGQERGAARELIRQVDSRVVIVHPDPKRIENPWSYEGFSIFRGSLFGAYKRLETLADELDEDWVFMTADPLPEEESSRERIVWHWRHITSQEDLEGVLLVAVNPRLVSYTPETGFRLGVPGDWVWQSPLKERKHRQRKIAYQRETYQEHIERMLRVYRYPFFDRWAQKERLALAEEVSYAARNLERKYDWPEGILDTLAKGAIALHDLGKLDVKWQEWARCWQEEVSKARSVDLRISDMYLAAHTDYDEQSEEEKSLNRKLSRKKPNHAAESAAAAMEWIKTQAGDESLARAALTAIVRHHSAGADGRYGGFRARTGSDRAVRETLTLAGFAGNDLTGIRWQLAAGTLSQRLICRRHERDLLAYLLLVRIVRLTDQRSQEIIG